MFLLEKGFQSIECDSYFCYNRNTVMAVTTEIHPPSCISAKTVSNNYKPNNWKHQTDYRSIGSRKITEYFYTKQITKNEDQV